MKYIFTLILLVITAGVFAQTDTTKNNDTEIDFGNVKVIVKDKKKYTVTKDSTQKEGGEVWDNEDEESYPSVDFDISFGWGVAGFSQQKFDLQAGNIVTSDASLELDYVRSRNYLINGNFSIDLTKNIGILTGVGFEFNRFVFSESLQVTPKDGYFQSDTNTNFSSYKFKTNYIQLPLMLKLQTDNQNFKFAIGGIFSYNIGNKVKAEFNDKNADYETITRANFNVAPVKIAVGARVAYKGIGLYFNYGLTEMNKDQVVSTDGRRNLMPFSAGITFGGL
jgi:hypothetical protein